MEPMTDGSEDFTNAFAVKPGRADGAWLVHLYHQCDEWDIAGEGYSGDGVSHAVAVANTEAFVAEAQRALAALRERQPYG
jgi:hypothetical protein